MRPLAEIDVSATAARHSFVTSSMMLRIRTRRPQASWDEVDGPARVGQRRQEERRSCSGRALATSASTHAQPLLAIEALRPLAVEHQPLLAKEHVQASVAEAPTLGCELSHARPQCRVGWPPRPVPHHLAINADNPARPPLAHLETHPQLSDRFAPCGGR